MSKLGNFLARHPVRTAFRWTFVGALLVISVLALLPAENVPSTLISWDKAQHAIAFAGLTGLGLLSRRWPATRVIVGLMIFGILMELTQGVLPWREGSFRDWVADALGIAFSYAVLQWLLPAPPPSVE